MRVTMQFLMRLSGVLENNLVKWRGGTDRIVRRTGLTNSISALCCSWSSSLIPQSLGAHLCICPTFLQSRLSEPCVLHHPYTSKAESIPLSLNFAHQCHFQMGVVTKVFTGREKPRNTHSSICLVKPFHWGGGNLLGVHNCFEARMILVSPCG